MAYARIQAPARLVCLGVLALLAAGCETLRTGSDYDRTASFAGYHTFALMPRQHQQVGNPLVVQRTEDAIRFNLTSRGFAYVQDPAQADFVVDFTLGSEERIDITSYPSPWVGRGGWYGGPGWWGRPYWGSNVNVRQYTEGTLSVDVFDGKTRRPVWHGWARKTLSQSDIEQSAVPINRTVAEVLKAFPPA
jgi:hypothetical protein